MASRIKIGLSFDEGNTFTDYSASTFNSSKIDLEFQKGPNTRLDNYAISSSLIFTGESFRALEAYFWGDNNCQKSITARVDFNCCEIPTKDFYITSTSIDEYCPDLCRMAGSLITKNTTRDAYRCLLNTDSKLVQSIQVINMEYLKVIPLSSPAQIGGAAVNSLIQLSSRKVNLVWEFLDYHARQCGLSNGLQSSILKGSKYSNMAFWPPSQEDNEESGFYNPIDLLNDLEAVFNAEWRIRDDALVFERRDYFYNNPAVVYDLAELLSNTDFCLQYADQEIYKGIKFSYSVDGSDQQASGAFFNRHYNGRHDYASFDPQVANGYREITPNVAFTPFVIEEGLVNSFGTGLWIAEDDFADQKVKLMIWNGQNPGRLITNSGGQNENYPLKFKTDAPANIADCDLFDQFFAFEEQEPCPQELPNNYVLNWNCELVNDILIHGTDIAFYHPSIGNGLATAINLDFDKKTITLKGLNFKYY